MKSSLIFSTRNRGNPAVRIAILILLAAASAAASLCMGAVRLPVSTVIKMLAGGMDGSTEANIVILARLPRTLGCLLAGMALAVSGAVIQNVLANPLAAPNIIGVNSGAGVMVALVSALLPASTALTPIAAFVGALGAVLLVLLIAEKNGASRITLVLAGVAVSTMFGAIIDAVITFFPDALIGYSDFRIGGFSHVSMNRVVSAMWMILPGILVLISMANEMDVLALGTDVAQSLGMNAKRIRLILLALAAALAGAAVSFAGLLGFVGLIVPQMMRRLVGEDSLSLLLACVFGGASMVTICDLLSRMIFAPYEIPVGILLSLIGGPFFIWLLLRQRGVRSHD